MRRTGLVLITLVLSLTTALPGFAKSKDKKQKARVEHRNFTFDGKQRLYYYEVPSTADPTKPLPAVVLLHAQGGWATDVSSLWQDYAARQGFIIIAPENLSNTMWDSRVDGPPYLHAVVAEVNKVHPIDPQRVFLFGETSGGVYALALGLYDANYWAATCVHQSILDTTNYSLFQHAPRKEPFLEWDGDNNPGIAMDVQTNQYEAFKKAGFPFDLHIIQNSTGAYLNVYDEVNEGCYKFFMKHPNPAPAFAASAAPAAPTNVSATAK